MTASIGCCSPPGLDSREVAVLRLYARFLRQTGTSFSLAYIEQTLARHGAIAAKLVVLFRHRFDPARADGTTESDRIAAQIEDRSRQGDEP